MKAKAFDPSLLGEKIREVRKKKGYTTKQAAEELNISQTYLRQIESGRCNKTPSLAIFVSICNLFHISPDYLLRDQLEENELSIIRETETLCRKASYSTQRIAAVMLKAALEELERTESGIKNAAQD
ncbi:MAG: helix-turn-helix domain-containing protein [Lachnospiraceae bacterium]|nr:helix-turn-helix domain-containing protein [Lachnospiraceae bacterium]